MAAGLEDEYSASTEARAGAILEAEFAFDLHAFRQEYVAAHQEK